MDNRIVRGKAELRQVMRKLRRAMPRDEAETRARLAAENLVRQVERRGARSVAMYAARGCELETTRVARSLLGNGVRLSYPRVVAGQRALAFHRVDDPESLTLGRFRVPEPHGSSAIAPLEEIDLFVVPGLAFDRRGARLGWGKGYYDATLSRARGARMGFCFDSQIVDCVPTADHDIRMELLVTDVGVVEVAGAPAERGAVHG